MSSEDSLLPLLMVEKVYDEDRMTLVQHLVKHKISFSIASSLDSFSSVKAFMLEWSWNWYFAGKNWLSLKSRVEN